MSATISPATMARPANWLATLRRWLLDPFSAKTSPEDARNIRLVAGLLLVGLAGIAIRLFFFTFYPIIAVSMVVALGAYGLARTRHYKISAALVMVALAAPSFVNAYVENSVERDIFTTRMLWIVLPIIFSSILFSAIETAAVVAILFGATLAMTQLMPGLTIANATGVLGIVGTAGLLAIVGIVHRTSVEKDRQAELRESNLILQESEKLLTAAVEELQISEAALEKRVAERTRELEEARAAAEQANETKSRFLANMSHELRTPLNAILNFTTFVADGVMGPVNERQADMLHKVSASGKHLLSLINDILDITKIEAGMMDIFIQEVDLGATLASAASVGAALVKDRPIEIVTEVDADLPAIYGDQRRLRQVFLNLLSNAAKFTREGAITLRATRKGKAVHIEVADTGVGIAPEDRDKLFASFKQVNKHDDLNVVGTGLGLPISKYFVEIHGGKISYKSKPDKGSTFFVDLPIQTREQADARNMAIREAAGLIKEQA